MTKPAQPAGWATRLPFFYGWIVVAVAFVTMAFGVNARTAFSLLFPPILDEFGWQRGTIAATFSVGFMVSTGLTPLIGILMDRYGPRLTIPLGALLVSSGLMTATLASQPWHFYVTLGALVVGGSVFISYIGHTLFLPNWFERRRGLALGLAFAGVGVGSMTLLPWMQQTIQSAGWRQSCWIVAIVLLLVVVPLNLAFQRRRPQDLRLQPDGAVAGSEEGGSGAPTQADGIVDRAWVETEWTLPRAMRTARFWWLMLSFSAGLYAWYAVQVHQTRYLIDIGITAKAAAYALGLVGLCGIAGQIAIGHLSDRVGREWAWTFGSLGFVATYACLLLLREWPQHWLMYIMVGAQGFLGYGLASVFGAVPAELFAGKRYGLIFGVIASAAGIGAALGPWAMGLMFDHWGRYDQSFVVAIAVCGISILGMWLAGPRQVRLVAGRREKV
ncbi:MAG: MFS transporter [Alphaproteobacteria bacterium]|nr:MFS transporter [Alphaproteobacteria bacterium]